MKYVNGLPFSKDFEWVALVKKLSPTILAGRLCPPGGHRESGESPEDAVARECTEETALRTKPEQWRLIATTKTFDAGAMMASYFTTVDDIQNATTCTDEEVLVIKTRDLIGLCIEHPDLVAQDLLTLVALALRARNDASLAPANLDNTGLGCGVREVPAATRRLAPGF